MATTGTVKSGFGNVNLYNGSTLAASAGSAVTSVNSTTTLTSPGFGYYYSFHFATPIVVPQANSVSLTLKGDVSSYSSSGATDNTTHVFKIANSSDTANATVPLTVVALGNTSNASSAIPLSSPNGNAMTLLRSKLTVSASPLGVTSGRSKASVDDLATLNFSANSAGGVQIGSVTIVFSGSGPSGTPAVTGSGTFFYTGSTPTACAAANCTVRLYDPANGTSYFAVASSTTGGNNLTFSLGNYQLSAGSSKSFTLRVDSTAANAFTTASTGVSQSLSATIGTAAHITWQDALDSAATGALNLESYIVPVSITSVSYAAGS